MAYRVAAPRASISYRRRGGCFTLSRSRSGSGRRGRSPLRRRRAVFPRSRPTLPSCTAAGRRRPGLCCRRPSARHLRSIPRRRRASAASVGEGGPGAGGGANGQRRSESTYTSDELCIPYSAGMLGSFSPYRASPYPRELTCFECQAVQHHYATDSGVPVALRPGTRGGASWLEGGLARQGCQGQIGVERDRTHRRCACPVP